MTFESPPDEGILAAFELPNLDATGLACEFGTGTARNLREFARRGFRAIGYDIASWAVEAAQAKIAEEGLVAPVLQQDVLELELTPNTLSAAILGTAIYWPKSQVFRYLDSLSAAVRRNGILHLEFATPQDSAYTSDFFLKYCWPYEEQGYDNSFLHRCGYICALDHPGVIGSSFWTYDDISKVVAYLEHWKVVHYQIAQLVQTNVEDTDHAGLFRSFERVTLQKMR